MSTDPNEKVVGQLVTDTIIFLYDNKSSIKSFTEVFGVLLDTFDPATETYDCYSHIGQHSSCSREYVLECDPAEPDDFMELYSEMEHFGYVLDVRQNLKELDIC